MPKLRFTASLCCKRSNPTNSSRMLFSSHPLAPFAAFVRNPTRPSTIVDKRPKSASEARSERRYGIAEQRTAKMVVCKARDDMVGFESAGRVYDIHKRD